MSSSKILIGPALRRSVAMTRYGIAYYGEATSSERLVCHAAPGFKPETEFLKRILGRNLDKVLIVFLLVIHSHLYNFA